MCFSAPDIPLFAYFDLMILQPQWVSPRPGVFA